MGDLGDKLGPGLLGHGGLLGNVVDSLGQLPDLIVTHALDLAAVAAGGDMVGKVGQPLDGVGDVAPEPEEQRNDGKACQHDHGAGQGVVPPGEAPYADEQQQQGADAGQHQFDA